MQNLGLISLIINQSFESLHVILADNQGLITSGEMMNMAVMIACEGWDAAVPILYELITECFEVQSFGKRCEFISDLCGIGNKTAIAILKIPKISTFCKWMTSHGFDKKIPQKEILRQATTEGQKGKQTGEAQLKESERLDFIFKGQVQRGGQEIVDPKDIRISA